MPRTDDELTPAEQREDLLADENDLLRGLFEYGDQVTERYARINIAAPNDPSKVLFSFRVRSMGGEELERLADKATVFERDRRTGLRRQVEFSNNTLTNLVIYHATHPEDRAALWDSKAAQKRYGVLSGPDLIERLLPVNTKSQVMQQIDALSDTPVTPAELAKN
jgi:hypothetical protein